MEEKYMTEIESVYGLIVNQNLTTSERQGMVMDILNRFRKQAEDWSKHKLKKNIIESIGNTVDDIFKGE